METMSASMQETQVNQGETLRRLVGESESHRAQSLTGHKRMQSEVSSRPSMGSEMPVHEEYWANDSQEVLDEAVADAKSFWISQGNNPQVYSDEQCVDLLLEEEAQGVQAAESQRVGRGKAH